jgi:hypothetical protein
MSYPGGESKTQVSLNGALQARWRSDGKEIFFIGLDGTLQSAEIRAKGATLEVGRLQTLFGGMSANGTPSSSYDVAPGGDRFLLALRVGAPATEPLTIVQNWRAALR